MTDTSSLTNMKDAVMAAIIDLGKEHDDVVMLDSDLASCLGSNAFKEKFPNRFFNCGIAEANMIGVGAGLSSMGFTPFAHTFGCFASRRDYDQMFISVGYAGQTLHLIGTDPGVTAQYNGGTHMPFEDIALMRQIPGLTIIEPSDAESCYDLIKQIYNDKKPSYIRVNRKGVEHRYKRGEAVLGKGIVLNEGKDLTIVATGALLVSKAVEAIQILNSKGIDATLIDLHTIRPLDTGLIENYATKTKKVLVLENGRYCGGIGEMIAGYLTQRIDVRMSFINVGEQFGEVGNIDYLCNTFGFTVDNIVSKAIALIK